MMDEIAAASARIIFPIIMIVGLAVSLHGHLSPGGGFAGGVVMATGFLLVFLTMRKGVVREIFIEKKLSFMESFGGFMILMIIILGASYRAKVVGTQRLFSLWSGEYSILMNLACSLMVVTAITLILWRYVE